MLGGGTDRVGGFGVCYRRLRYAGSDRMRRPCSCQTILVTPRYVMTSSVLSVELVSVANDRMKD